MKLLEIGAMKECEFMEKVTLKLLGSVLQAREKCYQKKATTKDIGLRIGCH